MKKIKLQNNLKGLILILVLLVTLAVLVVWYYFNKDNANLKRDKKGLNVIVSDWTGWTKEQPSDEKFNFDVSENDQFTLDGVGGPYIFVVQSVDKNSIRLKLPAGVSPEGQCGPMGNGDDVLTVQLDGKEYEACTNTMDAGTYYKFYYR